ncbi:hypothetical protein [uncultured Microbacterium sp.]|uniref:Uncharacterized protein n=1 Tax=uncultured Microbacterium sp. TaxID=191216 RepID=A0A1Y5P1H1_9MICO|nr:hypothetical protein [uncultured Microbacterium sp.]SBS69941.1 hypothetical protein MIPYR_10122 [uncultured Microbacterium sp.]
MAGSPEVQVRLHETLVRSGLRGHLASLDGLLPTFEAFDHVDWPHALAGLRATRFAQLIAEHDRYEGGIRQILLGSADRLGFNFESRMRAMAIVRNLVQGHQNVQAHPTNVEGYVQILLDESGRPLVHVSTWGSDNRKTAKKQSQVIQFDESSAGELVRYFVRAFGPNVLS